MSAKGVVSAASVTLAMKQRNSDRPDICRGRDSILPIINDLFCLNREKGNGGIEFYSLRPLFYIGKRGLSPILFLAGLIGLDDGYRTIHVGLTADRQSHLVDAGLRRFGSGLARCRHQNPSRRSQSCRPGPWKPCRRRQWPHRRPFTNSGRSRPMNPTTVKSAQVVSPLALYR